MATKTNVIVLTLASRCSGVVTRAELLDAGLSSSTIAVRARQGFLAVVWPGLYEVPEMTDHNTPLFRAVKSVSRSALTAESAGRMWNAPIGVAMADDPVHIVAPHGGAHTAIPGVIVHRTRRPYADNVRFPVPNLPTLSPARTILDLAGLPRVGDQRLAHIVESQLVAGMIDRQEITDLLDRRDLRGVAGVARLRSIAERLLDDGPVADSLLERRFAALLLDRRITGFRPQFRPPWFDGRRGVVDFANPAIALIVEVDGRRWHTTTQAMSEDRRRDRTAAAHGWQVLRVTWADLSSQPTRTADQLAAVVAARHRSTGRADGSSQAA